METFSVVDPEMDNDEMPEKTFVVADSEVDRIEQYITVRREETSFSEDML